VRADPTILDQIGTTQEDFDNWGARDKALAVQGVFQGRGAKQAAEATAAQAALRQAEAAKAQNDADATQGFPDFARFLNEEMTPGQSPAQPPLPGRVSDIINGGGPLSFVQTPGAPGGAATTTATNGQPQAVPMGQAVLRALAKVQAMNPRVAAAIASRVLPGLIQNATAGDEGTVNFTQDPVTGNRFATRGKTMMGSGVDPTIAARAMSNGAVPMQDGSGNVIGYNVPTGGGKFTYHPTKDLTPDQRQNLILQHQKAKSDLLGKLTVATDNTNIVNAINEEIGVHTAAIAELKGNTTTPQPSQSDVAYLKTHPTAREGFDKKFGAGAAAKVLGK